VTKTVTGAPEEESDKSFLFIIRNEAGQYVLADGSLSSSEVFHNLKNGETLTISNIAIGTYTVTELGTEKDGSAWITGYTLRASQTGSGAVTKDGKASVTLKNDYTWNLGKLKIVKTLIGLTEFDDPGALLFRVLGPGGFEKTVSLSEFTREGDRYSYTLPEDLKPGTYFVYELNALALHPAWKLLGTSVTAANTTVTASATAEVELLNEYEVAKTSASVMKIWDDMDNLDGSRPEKLKVDLMNGDEVVKTVELDEDNKWSAEVNELPLFGSDGKVITYTWKEQDVSGYKLSSVMSLGNATILTNSHEPELTSLTVKKVWDDNNNDAKMRPKSLAVMLSNGEEIVATVILNEDNKWTATVENLPVTVKGEKVTYTWSEQEVLGYTLASTKVDGDTTTLTNSFRKPGTPTTPTEYKGVWIINHVGDCFD
jgi:hypothetical protein